MAFASITRSVAANGTTTVTVPSTGEAARFRFVSVYVQNVGTGDAFLGSALASGLRFPAGMSLPVQVDCAPGDVLTFYAGATAVSDLRLGMAYQ